jgi:hypothetical protein
MTTSPKEIAPAQMLRMLFTYPGYSASHTSATDTSSVAQILAFDNKFEVPIF